MNDLRIYLRRNVKMQSTQSSRTCSVCCE